MLSELFGDELQLAVLGVICHLSSRMSNIRDECEARLRKVKKKAQVCGFDDMTLDRIWFESSTESIRPYRLWKRNIVIFIGVVFIVLLTIDWKLFELALCKIQNFIYPGLKILRYISIPIISIFPSLTELYDETCLIKNPIFRVVDLDCWPCRAVNRILEISKIDEDFLPETMSPFIYKSNQKRVEFEMLKQIYLDNRKIFDESASKISINDANFVQIGEFFMNYNETVANSYKWRLNRMSPARFIRTLYPRPIVMPKLGQSTERFIMIDNAYSNSYELPEPECNYVFLVQSTGERHIALHPVNECVNECKTIDILLKESYVLWYNWWYWRPISHSSKTNNTSISYIGSYC